MWIEDRKSCKSKTEGHGAKDRPEAESMLDKYSLRESIPAGELGQNEDGKMGELLAQVVESDNLKRALRRVIRNGGAAGTDGMQVKDLPGYLNETWPKLKEQIERGQYHPLPVLGIEIPKDSGGKRLLGIPTVLDRMIQQAIFQVLSPIWEEDFSDHSYGFRPGRSAQEAVLQGQAYINEGYQEVIDLDLKAFFDRVNHDKLMALIRAKIKDKFLLRLIRRYLQSGIMLGKVVRARQVGTPQGGPLSPLLSNILLNELDQELEKRGHRFVRYADDCSIYLRSKQAAKRVLGSISRFLEEKLLLEVNQEKTKICRPVKFTLLGYGFVSVYLKGVKGKYRLRVAPKSLKRLKLKLKGLTRKTRPLALTERIRQIKQLVIGWVQYFKYASSIRKLKELDGWLANRLRYCIWKQWKRPEKRRRSFIRLGVNHQKAYAWSRSRKGGWAIALSPMMRTTITIERLKRRGYLPFADYFFLIRVV